jgi:glycosyltransferase involved in cell wall biosynthesis
MSFVLCPDSYDLLFRLYFRVFVPLSARNADCVITDSQASRQDICRICKVSPEKVIVVPLGVTPDWFALNDSDTLSANIPEHIRNHRFVLAIGELTPRKNLARLIQAFAHLTRQALPYIPHLVLVGPAIRKLHKQHADRLKMQLEADGSEDRVHFLGVVPQSTLVALMRRAEALAFVSLHEGFGLPILEAMACGTPVLSSAVSSMPEVAGEAALLVNPKDVSEIADGLRRILFDQPLRQVLVEKGIARVKQFTWERTARGTIAVYRNVIERSSFDKTPRGALGDEQ